MPTRILLLLLIVWPAVAGTTPVVAQEDGAQPAATQETQAQDSTAPPAKRRTEQRSGALSAEQTEQALEFARQHHAELGELLSELKDSSPAGFRRGIREVHRTVQRLERFRSKQPTRHARELQRWKTESRIRLLTAQWLMSQDPELERQIKELLQQRQQTRLEQLTADRDKLESRLQQLEKQISRASDEQLLDQEWERLQKRATARANSRRPKKPSQTQ